MKDRDQTDELRITQLKREAAEEEQARSALDDTETAQHERRAEKARYLREKLEQRAEAERDKEG